MRTVGMFILIGFCGFVSCGLMARSCAKAIEDAPTVQVAKPERVSVPVRESTPAPELELPKEEDCSTTELTQWTDWLRALDINQARTEVAWKGRCQRVQGIVDSINSGMTGATVLIDTGKRFELNKLHCDPKDEQAAMGLVKGQKIIVYGKGGPEIMGSLFLHDCAW